MMPAVVAPAAAREAHQLRYQSTKARIHDELLDRLHLERLTHIGREAAEPQIRDIVQTMLYREIDTPLTLAERDALVADVLNELFGLGPLEPLMRDPTISDILVNRYSQAYVERSGCLERVDIAFRDDQHLLRIIERIVGAAGRRIDESCPMVDARLADGSRINAVIPPLAIDGPVLSIRRFPIDRYSGQDLVARGSLTLDMLEFLAAAVRCRLNVVVSGGTGAGKTTLLNVLSGFISERERIVTIEDAAELRLRQQHVVRLETRPANIEGRGAVRQRELVINALRMRPDRIIVGEVRGEEAVDMLQAMNTGHDGSLTTVHANSPRDALYRLDTMVAMANLNIPERAVRQQIASAVHLIVQLSRMQDGSRKVTQISEIVGIQGSVVAVQDLFVFERAGVDSDGRVLGRFRNAGNRARCLERFAAYGVSLDPGIFNQILAAG